MPGHSKPFFETKRVFEDLAKYADIRINEDETLKDIEEDLNFLKAHYTNTQCRSFLTDLGFRANFINKIFPSAKRGRKLKGDSPMFFNLSNLVGILSPDKEINPDFIDRFDKAIFRALKSQCLEEIKYLFLSDV